MSLTYHKIIRKIITGFGDIFDDISLIRYKEDGTEDHRFAVPITYAPKEKYVAKLYGDPDLNKKIQIMLPRMSFEMTGLGYDSSRKLNTNVKSYAQSGAGTAYLSYNPVPYNFNFELNLYVRNIEDGHQIIERILPFFTPDYTIKLNLVAETNTVKEIPISLDSISHEIDYEGVAADSPTRMIIWTLSFTVKGFLYGPLSQSKIIKESIVNLRNMNTILSKDTGIILNMANTGFGTFKEGELVFQGYNLNSATATGVVQKFNTSNYELTINQVTGNFKTNTVVHGVTTASEYTLSSFKTNNGLLVTIDVTYTPNTALANGNFQYVTSVTEYN